jgi:hypothetical protein
MILEISQGSLTVHNDPTPHFDPVSPCPRAYCSLDDCLLLGVRLSRSHSLQHGHSARLQ